MGKFKMPDVEQLLSKKRIYDEKKEPVWDYLEHEMRENVDKKPYNEKVGSWLKYLKELRYYKFKEGRRKTKRLHKEAGPPWFYELSSKQREILRDLKTDIHQDLLEDLPTRVRRALGDLGITLKLEDEMLMQAMQMSTEDAGLFFWNLYSYYYNKNPNDLQKNYDMNARIMLSALVFVDLDDCIAQLEELLKQPSTPQTKPKKKKKKYFEPKVKYGEYLQKMYVPFFTTHPDEEEEAERKKNLAKPLPPDYKIKLRSAESKERLRKDTTFLKKRKERNTEEKAKSDRECHYKFWEPPSTLRNTDPKMAAYVMKLKMFKEKARPKFMKYKAPFENLQLHIGTVAYTGGHPNFILNNAVTLPTGYIPINGGAVRYGTEYITNILGYWKFPRDTDDKCDTSCDCAAKWEGKVMDYIKSSKCKCGHRYDLYNEGKPTEKYFYKSKREGAFWIDHAKIYQMDPTEDFIKDTVKEAVRSVNVSGTTLNPTIAASGLKPEQLLDAFLGDLHDTPLLIPHLPKANLLNNLKEWTRKRVQGPLTQPNHRKLLLQSQRRWLDLKHMDYRARACRIPFTQKQLRNMDWSHRDMIQKLFNNLLNDFTTRSRRKQVEQTRMWWSTMKNDAYPNKAFAEIFFTYMPGRMKDSFLLNPYSANLIPKGGGKTCPLG